MLSIESLKYFVTSFQTVETDRSCHDCFQIRFWVTQSRYELEVQKILRYMFEVGTWSRQGQTWGANLRYELEVQTSKDTSLRYIFEVRRSEIEIRNVMKYDLEVWGVKYKAPGFKKNSFYSKNIHFLIELCHSSFKEATDTLSIVLRLPVFGFRSA